MPWFEEITSQRDTTGGVACSNLLCLPVRHILSLPSDAAQPTQVPRAKEDARELYAATDTAFMNPAGEIDPADSENDNESIDYVFPSKAFIFP